MVSFYPHYFEESVCKRSLIVEMSRYEAHYTPPSWADRSEGKSPYLASRFVMASEDLEQIFKGTELYVENRIFKDLPVTG